MASEPRAMRKWTSRLAAGAFLFFLVKGVLWLVVGALAMYGCTLVA